MCRDVDLLDTMLETLDVSCSRPPSLVPGLIGSPTCTTARGRKGKPEVSTDRELCAVQEQMLMLRNANLTYYECERAVAAEADKAVQDEKYGFLRTMEELESEILELDDTRSAGAEFGAAYSRYKNMLTKVYADNKSGATRDLFSAFGASKAAPEAAPELLSSHDAARPDNALSPTRAKQMVASAISKRKYVVGRIHSEHCTALDGARSRGQGWTAEEMDTEDEDSSFWVQKDAQSGADIHLFKMWNKRAIGPRDRVRELGDLHLGRRCLPIQCRILQNTYHEHIIIMIGILEDSYIHTYLYIYISYYRSGSTRHR